MQINAKQQNVNRYTLWSSAIRSAGLLLLVALLAACGGREEPTPIPAAATAEAAPAQVTPEGVVTQAPTIPESPLQAESPLVSPLALPEVAPVSPLPTPPEVAAEEGAVVGRVLSLIQPGNPPLYDTTVKVGMIQWREDGSDGDFAIDGARGPSAVTQQDGTFVINNLLPGDYVAVIGDLIGRHEVLVTPEGKAQVFTVVAGEVTDMGNLFVNLP